MTSRVENRGRRVERHRYWQIYKCKTLIGWGSGDRRGEPQRERERGGGEGGGAGGERARETETVRVEATQWNTEGWWITQKGRGRKESPLGKATVPCYRLGTVDVEVVHSVVPIHRVYRTKYGYVYPKQKDLESIFDTICHLSTDNLNVVVKGQSERERARARARACVCVCVWEREREKERD